MEGVRDALEPSTHQKQAGKNHHMLAFHIVLGFCSCFLFFNKNEQIKKNFTELQQQEQNQQKRYKAEPSRFPFPHTRKRTKLLTHRAGSTFGSKFVFSWQHGTSQSTNKYTHLEHIHWKRSAVHTDDWAALCFIHNGFISGGSSKTWHSYFCSFVFVG